MILVTWLVRACFRASPTGISLGFSRSVFVRKRSVQGGYGCALHFDGVAASPECVSLRASVIAGFANDDRVALAIHQSDACSENAVRIIRFRKQHGQFQHVSVDFEECGCTCAIAGKACWRAGTVQDHTLTLRAQRHVQTHCYQRGTEQSNAKIQYAPQHGLFAPVLSSSYQFPTMRNNQL